MPEIDINEDVFLAVPPRVVARRLASPALWRNQWPDLALEVRQDRGTEGIRWGVAGTLEGSMEVWLEPLLDGTLLHYFLRADFAGGVSAHRLSARRRQRLAVSAIRYHRLQARALAFCLKEELEAGRPAGWPPQVAANSVPE